MSDELPKITVRQLEAAKLLSISDRTLRDWTNAGIIPCIRVDRAVLYSVEALRKWSLERASGTDAAPIVPDATPPNPASATDLLVRIIALAAAPTPEGLRAEDAAAFVGVGRSRWHEMNSRGECPMPVELGDRLPVWPRTELIAWLLAGAPRREKWSQIRNSAIRRISG